MQWQDYSFTLCSILFSYSLMPQIYMNYKNKDASGLSWNLVVTMLIACTLCSVTAYTLGLFLTVGINTFQILAWITIIYQKTIWRN